MTITTTGFEGTVTELEYAQTLAAGARPSVVDEGSWRLAVVNGNRQVKVAEGTGTKGGMRTTSTTGVVVNLPTPVATNGLWYLIVCRITWGDTRDADFIALPGTGIAERTALTPPRYYPAGYRSDPGVVDDQAIGWAFVNDQDTDVQVFDLRELAPGTLPGLNYKVEGASGGYSQPKGQGVNHASVDLNLEIQRWVNAVGSICLFVNGNVAGELQILSGGTIMRSRRWHSHARGGRLDIAVAFGFSVQPDASTVALRLTIDTGSDGGAAVYDADLQITADPA